MLLVSNKEWNTDMYYSVDDSGKIKLSERIQYKGGHPFIENAWE